MELFSARLRQARENFPLTRKEMAEKLHITRQAYERYENNTAEPSLSMLVQISKILQESTDYLLGANE